MSKRRLPRVLQQLSGRVGKLTRECYGQSGLPATTIALEENFNRGARLKRRKLHRLANPPVIPSLTDLEQRNRYWTAASMCSLQRHLGNLSRARHVNICRNVFQRQYLSGRDFKAGRRKQNRIVPASQAESALRIKRVLRRDREDHMNGLARRGLDTDGVLEIY